mgnify:FL=1
MKQKPDLITVGKPVTMNNNPTSSLNFKSASHVYFFTSDGKRLVDDKNIRKCERYLVRQLNGAKNLKTKNKDLYDTFKKGDKDYTAYSIARSFYEYHKRQYKAIISIITGKNVAEVNIHAKRIGEAKSASKGSDNSYETLQAIRRYNDEATKIVRENGIYQGKKRQAFGIIFEPQYKQDGELKELKYVRSAWFDENKVKK